MCARAETARNSGRRYCHDSDAVSIPFTATFLCGLTSAVRIAARCGALVLQRTKRLAHVVEFAQGRVELLRLRRALTLFGRRTLEATAHIQREQNDDDQGQGDEGGCHVSER